MNAEQRTAMREDGARALRSADTRLTRSLSLELADCVLEPAFDELERAEADRGAALDLLREMLHVLDLGRIPQQQITEARAFLARVDSGTEPK